MLVCKVSSLFRGIWHNLWGEKGRQLIPKLGEIYMELEANILFVSETMEQIMVALLSKKWTKSVAYLPST